MALGKVIREVLLVVGKAYFVFANPLAINANVRFVKKNLNRLFLSNNSGQFSILKITLQILPFGNRVWDNKNMFWVRKNILPNSVKQVLWSYDTTRIDLQRHRCLIVSQVLNYGNREATDWLFRQYGQDEVANIAKTIPLGQWDKKSLALWSLILNISPTTKSFSMAER